MAVEIIKHGSPPEDRKYEVVCGNCRTIFTFLRSDGAVHTHRNEVSVCCRCPVCKKECCTDADNFK